MPGTASHPPLKRSHQHKQCVYCTSHHPPKPCDYPSFLAPTHRTVPCFAAGLCVCVFVSRGPGTSAPFVGADVWGRSRLDSCRCSGCCVVSVLPVVQALQLWVPLYSGSAGWGRSGAVVSSCLVDHACRCPQCPAFGTWGGWVVVVCWCGLVWGFPRWFSRLCSPAVHPPVSVLGGTCRWRRGCPLLLPCPEGDDPA